MQCLLSKWQALHRKPCVYAGLEEQFNDSTEVRKGANTTKLKNHQCITHLQIRCLHLVCSDALFPYKHSHPSYTKQLSVSSLLPSGCDLCHLISSKISLQHLLICCRHAHNPDASHRLIQQSLRLTLGIKTCSSGSLCYFSFLSNRLGDMHRNNNQTFKTVKCKELKCSSHLDAFSVQRQWILLPGLQVGKGQRNLSPVPSLSCDHEGVFGWYKLG